MVSMNLSIEIIAAVVVIGGIILYFTMHKKKKKGVGVIKINIEKANKHLIQASKLISKSKIENPDQINEHLSEVNKVLQELYPFFSNLEEAGL